MRYRLRSVSNERLLEKITPSPVTSNQQPATSDQQPATSNQRPVTSNQQPATGDRQTEPYNEHFKKSSAKSTRQGNVKVNSKPVESEGFTKH